MRIGEIAALAGVTPRAVRHYHHLGLIPEPERLSNGYRHYRLSHAVALVRVRRLTELGLGLAEVRDVLTDDAGRELAEVLEELDADLASQEAALAERRARLGELMEQARAGRLPAEGPVSSELTAILATLGTSDSPMVAKDRTHMALLDGVMAPEDRERLFTVLQPLTEDPIVLARLRALYGELDELADADVDDPRITPLAQELVACMPEGLTHLVSKGSSGLEAAGDPFGKAFLADFAPAQAAVIQEMLMGLSERMGHGARPGTVERRPSPPLTEPR